MWNPFINKFSGLSYYLGEDFTEMSILLKIKFIDSGSESKMTCNSNVKELSGEKSA